LCFYKSRYYSPIIGRFLQPDDIGYEDGLNLYAYVDSKPINFVDPYGLASEDEDSGGESSDEESGSYEETYGALDTPMGPPTEVKMHKLKTIKGRRMYTKSFIDSPRQEGLYSGVETKYKGESQNVQKRVNNPHKKLKNGEAVIFKSMPGSQRFDRQIQETKMMGPKKPAGNDRYSVSKKRWIKENVPGPHPSLLPMGPVWDLLPIMIENQWPKIDPMRPGPVVLI